MDSQVPANHETKPSFWKTRLFQYASIYFVGTWTLIESCHFIIERFLISPYWTDILLTIFLTISPGIIYYTYISNTNWKFAKSKKLKLILGLNGIITLIILFVLFGQKDLGYISQEVKITDENGSEQIVQTVKPQFMDKLVCFSSPDSSSVSQALLSGISMSLMQFKEIDISIYNRIIPTMEKLEHMKIIKADYAVEANFKKVGEDSVYLLSLYDSKYKLVDRISFDHSQLIVMIDSAVDMIKTSIHSSYLIQRSPFLSVGDIVSWNEQALIHISNHRFDLAVDVDSSSALANVMWFIRNYDQTDNEFLEGYIRRAMKYRTRLPERWQMMTKVCYFLFNYKQEKAVHAMENYAKLYPTDLLSLRFFINVSLSIERTDLAESLLSKIRSTHEDYFYVAQKFYLHYFHSGEYEKAEIFMKEMYSEHDWQYHVLKGELQLCSGLFSKAIESFEQASLENPDYATIDSLIVCAKYYEQLSSEDVKEKLNLFAGEFYDPFNGKHESATNRIDNYRIYNEIKEGNSHYYYLKGDSSIIGYFFMGNFEVQSLTENKFRLKVEDGDHFWFVWKYDTTLYKAESYFMKGELDSCTLYCNRALAVDSTRYWLKDYLSSLEYSTSNEFNTQGTREFIGSYSNSKIASKKGKLYLEEMGDSFTNSRSMLLFPLKKDWFISLKDSHFRLEFVREQNVIKGIQRHYIDQELLIWPLPSEKNYSPLVLAN